jgi:hypothetical protein
MYDTSWSPVTRSETGLVILGKFWSRFDLQQRNVETESFWVTTMQGCLISELTVYCYFLKYNVKA